MLDAGAFYAGTSFLSSDVTLYTTSLILDEVMHIKSRLSALEALRDAGRLVVQDPIAERIPQAYEEIASIAMEFRIPVIHTPSAEYTAQFLMTLAKRSLKEGKASGPLLRKIKKENPVYLQQLSVLSSVPGVGDKLAARLLNKFNTPARALSASAAELATIPGFGLARAERVRRVLDSPSSASKVIQRTLFDPEQ